MGIFPNSFPLSDLIKLFEFFVVLSALQHVRVVGARESCRGFTEVLLG